MISKKRKRDSSDSAVADLFSSSSSDPSHPQSDPDVGSAYEEAGRHQEKREAKREGIAPKVADNGFMPDFSGDYGTAASRRPRRQTRPQAAVITADEPDPAPKKVKASTVGATAKSKLATSNKRLSSTNTIARSQDKIALLVTSRELLPETNPTLDATKSSCRSTHLNLASSPEKTVTSKATTRRNSLPACFAAGNYTPIQMLPPDLSRQQDPHLAAQGSPKISRAENMGTTFENRNSNLPQDFAQPRSAVASLDSQDRCLLNSSRSALREAELRQTRHSSAPVEGNRTNLMASPQQDTIPTLILNTSKMSIDRELEEYASSGDTVSTILNDEPIRPIYAPPLELESMSLVLSDADSDDLTQPDELTHYTGDPEQKLDDNQLRHIIFQLFEHRDTDTTRKPEPLGKPAVWADGRQDLCETLHYFRSYQSACYCTGGFVKGFMFDKASNDRDYIDSNVVIARAGGGLLKDKDSGEMKFGSKDHVESVISQALRNCMRHFNPLVIITGIDNPQIPSKPPHQYCVMDYFKPTHIWVEKHAGRKMMRYRFEKLNPEKESWWRARGAKDPNERLGSLPPPISKKCAACEKFSPQIYLNGWMCLQPSCHQFWHIFLGQGSISGVHAYEPDETELIYDPRFLKQRTPWPNDEHEYPLVPNTAELSNLAIPGEDTSHGFWLGAVCPKCGRCNARVDWVGWRCLNPVCDFKKEPPHTLIPARSIREALWPVTDSYTLSRDIQSPLLELKVSFAHGYRVNRYEMPGVPGFITHMIANKTVLEEPGGPDAMFEELQRKDIGLARRKLPVGSLKGDAYTRHFLVNYGMPYKFIAATETRPFEGAAQPITATRSRLNWAASYLLSREDGADPEEVRENWKRKEFNEVLTLGYFEAQKINYHDDGEFGLGPTIATISLGAPGSMRIRMKARHYQGVSPGGIYNDVRPVPGCVEYERRNAIRDDLDRLKRNDKRAYKARLKEIPKELELKSSGNARDALRLELGHGDIVVMHGEELQMYYEHAVEHTGKLRFALTCRYIDPGSLREEDRVEHDIQADEGMYDGSLLDLEGKGMIGLLQKDGSEQNNESELGDTIEDGLEEVTNEGAEKSLHDVPARSTQGKSAGSTQKASAKNLQAASAETTEDVSENSLEDIYEKETEKETESNEKVFAKSSEDTVRKSVGGTSEKIAEENSGQSSDQACKKSSKRGFRKTPGEAPGRSGGDTSIKKSTRKPPRKNF